MHNDAQGIPWKSLSVMWWRRLWYTAQIWLADTIFWVGYGPVGGLGRVPRPPSGLGSRPLALGHQLGMCFTKAPPKFRIHVIIYHFEPKRCTCEGQFTTCSSIILHRASVQKLFTSCTYYLYTTQKWPFQGGSVIWFTLYDLYVQSCNMHIDIPVAASL